jgi:small GTP-binding protein
MLGDTNAGKTSLVLRFAEGYYRDAARSATVGAFFITKRIQTSGGITCKVQIWDTAGQEQFRAMAPMYYRNAAAAIVCYDVTSRRSFDVMREWLEELHKNVPAGSIVLAIAATKIDLIPVTEEENLVLRKEGEELAQALGAVFVDTSAKTNTNVEELYRLVSERVLRFREHARKGLIKVKRNIPVTPGATAGEVGVKRNGGGAHDIDDIMNGDRNGHGNVDDTILDDNANGANGANSPDKTGCDPLSGCGVLTDNGGSGSSCSIQ